MIDNFLHARFGFSIHTTQQNVFLLAERDQFVPGGGTIQTSLTNADYVTQHGNSKFSKKRFG